MLEIIALAAIIGCLLIIPTLTGYMATGLGRPFKKWFLLGCVLPVISLFILLLLPDKSKAKPVNPVSEEKLEA